MALGNATFTDVGGAVSDIFSGFGNQVKAQGDFAEAKLYSQAAALAEQNVGLTEQATSIQEMQEARNIYQTISSQESGVAAGGFEESGSALDLLADSTQQGKLAEQLIQTQGQISENAYQEQANSYTAMATAATSAGNAANTAGVGAFIASGVKGVAAIATLA